MIPGNQSVCGGAAEFDAAEVAYLEIGEADECHSQEPSHRRGGGKAEIVVGFLPDCERKNVCRVARTSKSEKEDRAHPLKRRNERTNEVYNHERHQLWYRYVAKTREYPGTVNSGRFVIVWR